MCTKSIEDGTRIIMCTHPHTRVPGRGHICPARDPEWDTASWLLFNLSPPGIGSPTGQIWKRQYLCPPQRDHRAHTHRVKCTVEAGALALCGHKVASTRAKVISTGTSTVTMETAGFVSEHASSALNVGFEEYPSLAASP